MNVRDRCSPIYNKKLFKTCCFRVRTAYEYMIDDEIYEKINKYKTKKQQEKVMVSYLHHKLKIISRAEKEKIIKYFWIENEALCCIGYSSDDDEEPSEEEKERLLCKKARYNMNDVIADIEYKTKLYDPIIITLNGADKFWGTYLEEGIAFCEAGVEVDTNYWQEGKKYSHELGHEIKKLIIKISGCKIEIV